MTHRDQIKSKPSVVERHAARRSSKGRKREKVDAAQLDLIDWLNARAAEDREAALSEAVGELRQSGAA